MNQLRQQAFGNILSSLWLGSKVFLNPQNTIYSYLKSLGIHIYSVEDINSNNPEIIQNLEDVKASKNKEILGRFFSLKNIILQTKKLASSEIESFFYK
jgi:hypothetical protein